MRSSRRWAELRARLRDDRGSASIEFVGAGLLLLVPIVYLVLALAAIQAGAFAAEAAARQAARLFVLQSEAGAAQAAAERAITVALADYGVAADAATVAIACAPAACLDPGSVVTVSVTVGVPLPLVPPVLQGAFPLEVAVEGTAAQLVSRFGAG